MLVHTQAGITLCVELKVSDLFFCNLMRCDYIMLLVWHASPANMSAFVDAPVASIMERVETTSILHVVFDRY